MGSGKTARLVARITALLDTVPAEQLLVLCSNHARQKDLTRRVQRALNRPVAQLPVYTFTGLVRTSLFDYWPLAEARIPDRFAPQIRPELAGLGDTEFLLGWLLARQQAQAVSAGQPEPFADFPGNVRGLKKQLVRRLRLRSENGLTREDMAHRSALLGEMCQPETAELERQYDRLAYTLRLLDTNKQIDVFLGLLASDTPLRAHLTGSIRHLIADDMDETVPVQQTLIRTLTPTLQSLTLAADTEGGSRRGYLNAYPYDWPAMKQLMPGETVQLSPPEERPMPVAAQTLLSNWLTPDSEAFKPLPACVTLRDDAITRTEMIDQVVSDITAQLKAGLPQGAMALVLPKSDPLTNHQLKLRLRPAGVPLQFLSGTRRAQDNPHIRYFLQLFQLLHAVRWQWPLSHWELKNLLARLWDRTPFTPLQREVLTRLIATLHLEACRNAEAAESGSALPDEAQVTHAYAEAHADAAAPAPLPAEALNRYAQLRQWLRDMQPLTPREQLYDAFARWVAPGADAATKFDPMRQLIDSYLRHAPLYERLQTLAGEAGIHGPLPAERLWLQHAKSGAVADSPENPTEADPNALVIGTPQKIIDLEIRREHQFWLDAGSREWARSDNAPLYNAWVHSAVWRGETDALSPDFQEAVIRQRAGHITRTLMLLAQSHVTAYASELDELGFTHSGQLKPRLLCPASQVALADNLPAIRLRADQEGVLDYERGAMAISAVPGAGKTFVNVALILRLIENGVAPDSILVLTYMDSAAKTLLSRLKQRLQGRHQGLPLVSTIHSLAFRILTENDQSLRLGFLPEDVTILDDYARGAILEGIAAQTQPEGMRNLGDWTGAIDTGIAHAKGSRLSPDALDRLLRGNPAAGFRLNEFLPAYRAYQKALHDQGALDFSDLIVKAIDLLESDAELRAHYQQQFRVIMEDEAQDSSRLLQHFIRLLGGEQPNLIRTGDTNQSITTTFSAADPDVFRQFIREADRTITMDRSGRCAPEVMVLANRWIQCAGETPVLSQAFTPVAMQAAGSQNPTLLQPLSASVHEYDHLEQALLVDQIRAVQSACPQATMAVLVRRNAQVNHLAAMLQQAGIPAVAMTDKLKTHHAFVVLESLMQWLMHPVDLTRQQAWMEAMRTAGLWPLTETEDLDLAPLWMTHNLLLGDPRLKTLLPESLLQLHYDLQDFQRQLQQSPVDVFMVHVGERWFERVEDRSNAYLCALMAGQILADETDEAQSPVERVLQQFEAYRLSWRGRRGFPELPGAHAFNVVQVMSLHKAKGQEFDAVWMPGLQADLFPVDPQKVRMEESDKIVMAIDQLQSVHMADADSENPADIQQRLKARRQRDKIEEEARLIYVGITRARRALFVSAHRQAITRYGKYRPSEPAFAFEQLSRLIQALQPATVSETHNGEVPAHA